MLTTRSLLIGVGLGLAFVKGLAAAEPLLPKGATIRLGAATPATPELHFFSYLSDDEYLVITRDEEVLVRQAETGEVLKRFKPVRWHAFSLSPDRRRLAMADRMGIQLWDPRRGEKLAECQTAKRPPKALELTQEVWATAKASQVLIESLDGVFRLWDIEQNREVARFGQPQNLEERIPPRHLGLTPDGQVFASLATERDGMRFTQRLLRWQIADGKALADISLDEEGPFPVALLDRHTLLSASIDGQLILRDLSKDREVGRLAGAAKDGFVHLVERSPDGKLLAGLDAQYFVQVWRLADRRLLARLDCSDLLAITTDSLRMRQLSISPSGRRLAALFNSGAVRQWDLESGKELAPRHGHHGAVAQVAVNGQTAATWGLDHRLLRWDLKTGRVLDNRRPPTDVGLQALSADGRWLAQAGWDDTIRLWDVATGQEARRWPAHQPVVAVGETFRGLAFSPEGQTLASHGYDGVLSLWDARTGKEIRRYGRGGDWPLINTRRLLNDWAGPGCAALIFSPTGERMATVALEVDLKSRPPKGAKISSWQVWDIASGRLLRRGSTQELIVAVAFTADGRGLLAATAGHSPYVIEWEIASGQPRLRYATPGQSRLVCLTPSPDGRGIAGGDPLGNLHVWDSRDGRHLQQYSGHAAALTRLLWQPDRLISASADTTLLAWQPPAWPAAAAPTPADPDRLAACWEELASADARKARAAALLLAGWPQETVTFLGPRLKPAPAPADAELRRWMGDLASADFPTRERASQELEQLGELAEPALRAALANRLELEMRQRLEQLLERLSDKAYPAADLQALRAVEVLEWINSTASHDLLKALAGGAEGAERTRQARQSLARLSPKK